jgi:PAS domain S-box-containing protein
MKTGVISYVQSHREPIIADVMANVGRVLEPISVASGTPSGVLEQLAAKLLDLTLAWIESPDPQVKSEHMAALVQNTFFTGKAGEAVCLLLALKRSITQWLRDRSGDETAVEFVLTISDVIDQCLLEYHITLMRLFGQVVGKMTDHLQSYMAETTDLVLLLHPDTAAILDANAVAEQALGYTRAELQQRRLFDLVSTARQSLVTSALHELKQSYYVDLHEVELVAKDGRTVPVIFNPLLRQYSASQFIIGIFNNLAEKRELERQLQERAAGLERTVARQMRELQQRQHEILQRNNHLVILNTIAATVSQSLDLEQVLKDALEEG